MSKSQANLHKRNNTYFLNCLQMAKKLENYRRLTNEQNELGTFSININSQI